MKKKPPLADLIPPGVGLRRDITPEALRAAAEASLREMAAWLASDNPAVRMAGEARLKEAASGLAKRAEADIRAGLGSNIGKQKRLQVGERKAQQVDAAIRKGIDPPVGERQLRRIRNRHK